MGGGGGYDDFWLLEFIFLFQGLIWGKYSIVSFQELTLLREELKDLDTEKKREPVKQEMLKLAAKWFFRTEWWVFFP